MVLQQVLTDLVTELRAADSMGSGASVSPPAVAAPASSSLGALGHGLPFVTVHINGYAITDDASAAREISAQLAIDPEAAAAADAAERDAETIVQTSSAETSSASPPARHKRGRASATPAGTKVERHTVAHACVRAHRQTFEQHLEYVVATLRDGCSTGRPVVLVIDEFDVFCARTKQTLLYNLLDLTQDPT